MGALQIVPAANLEKGGEQAERQAGQETVNSTATSPCQMPGETRPTQNSLEFIGAHYPTPP